MITLFNDLSKFLLLNAQMYTSMFINQVDVHAHITRYCSNLQITKCRTNTSQQSFIYRVTKLWNSLPTELKEIKAVKVFKNSLKRTLLENWLNA